jgi:hypothetical protein
LDLNPEARLKLIGQGYLPEPTDPRTKQEIAAWVVAGVLRDAGTDVHAMGVIKADDLDVWIFMPRSLDDSLLQKVRNALKETLPNSPKVSFYTSGETEMKLISSEPEEPSDGVT